MLRELIKRLFNEELKKNDGIIHQYQRNDYDCGQTCLDMLGYDGHNMFQGKALEIKELASLPGVRRLDDVRLSKNTYFENPCILNVMGATESEIRHYALAYKDRIYCPSLGVFKVKKYLRMIWSWVEIFEVPLKRKTSEN